MSFVVAVHDAVPVPSRRAPTSNDPRKTCAAHGRLLWVGSEGFRHERMAAPRQAGQVALLASETVRPRRSGERRSALTKERMPRREVWRGGKSYGAQTMARTPESRRILRAVLRRIAGLTTAGTPEPRWRSASSSGAKSCSRL